MLIKRKGRNGGELAPPILVQCHLDMVTEKNADKTHNFFSDPIELIPRGIWLFANGTTLGADNGIGVAAVLALLEDEHSTMPPLECLFTIGEEIGLAGARQLDVSALGITAKTMLNLDTEEYGTVYIGCAGGGDSLMTVSVSRRHVLKVNTFTDFTVKLHGLTGGHSGADIHRARGNAILLMAQTVHKLLYQFPTSRLVDFRGGDKRNAIPREAQAIVRIPTRYCDDAKVYITNAEKTLRRQYKETEPLLQLSSSVKSIDTESIVPAMSRDSSDRLLLLLRLLPCGALAMSDEYKDAEGKAVCETSNNVASVKPSTSVTDDAAPDAYDVTCLTRSLYSKALTAVRDKITSVADISDAKCVSNAPYPGWAPDASSPILSLLSRVMKEQTGDVKVAVIHGGLECGLLREIIPNLDVVSFGPTIRGAHTPEECVLIPSVASFYSVLLAVLEQYALTTK